jgi:hypothetical protein
MLSLSMQIVWLNASKAVVITRTLSCVLTKLATETPVLASIVPLTKVSSSAFRDRLAPDSTK